VNSGLIAAMDLGNETDSIAGPSAAFAHRSELAIRCGSVRVGPGLESTPSALWNRSLFFFTFSGFQKNHLSSAKAVHKEAALLSLIQR
jgi:hypothetical protein